jgi:hypothetical protein
MKKCNKCNIEKFLNEFCKDKYSPDGLDYKCKTCRKEYFKQNKESYRKRTAKWKENNLDKWREQDSIRQKKRRKEKPYLRKWACLLENTLKRLNKSKENSTQESLKYSALELKEHLDSLGMIWGYHQIDHKVPVTWFKEDTPPHIVNDLRNLQPLSPEENQIKGNKFNSDISKDYLELIKPFLKKCLDIRK